MEINPKEQIIYTRNDQVVYVDPSNLFVYETSVYVYHKNYFSLCKQDYYSCPNEIPGVVGSFFKTPYIQICSELFSAPEQWLIDNKFNRYIKPKKIKKIETKTEK